MVDTYIGEGDDGPEFTDLSLTHFRRSDDVWEQLQIGMEHEWSIFKKNDHQRLYRCRNCDQLIILHAGVIDDPKGGRWPELPTAFDRPCNPVNFRLAKL